MPDHAHSADPAVQAQLDRLTMLSPGRDVLGLERIAALMDRLGNPHRALPPVFHIAGTNGKGSTAAFLRAMLEAAGYVVHAYTSPHLVRFNERIRVAGTLIDDAALAPLLAEILDQSADIAPSFFEATTAAAFLAFARTPADAAIIEVGLGGRLDATNVIERPLVTGIASLGIDHVEFLLAPDDTLPPMAPLERIAFEKAGIAKSGVPLVTQNYPPAVAHRITTSAAHAGATLVMRGRAWSSSAVGRGFVYADQRGKFYGNPPRLAGDHQRDNAALAIAMLRHQPLLTVNDTAINRGLATALWPARLQLLGAGPLRAMLPPSDALWLDGGHNGDGAARLAESFADHLTTRGPVDVIVGMLANKDAAQFLSILAPVTRSVIGVPVPGQAHHDPADLARMASSAGIGQTGTAPDLETALAIIAQPGRRADNSPRRSAILGSLYLAGEALRLNGEVPQ